MATEKVLEKKTITENDLSNSEKLWLRRIQKEISHASSRCYCDIHFAIPKKVTEYLECNNYRVHDLTRNTGFGNVIRIRITW